ncbi:ergot alkaloid biosynthesis protein [Micromonospora chokoriensis]
MDLPNHHPSRVLVTGATGTTGSRVAAALDARITVVRASRTVPAGTEGYVRFDWYDPTTHKSALAGVDALYLIPPTGDVDPARVVMPLLEAAVADGLQRVVLLGAQSIATGDPGAGTIQGLLPGLVDEWAVLRPSWFMQNLLAGHHLARSLRASRTLYSATDNGQIPFVDADDIAAVAVTALLGEPLQREVLITGPEPLSYDDVAAIFSDVTGLQIRHRGLSEAAMREALSEQFDQGFAAVLAALDRRVAAGEWREVTDEVQRLTGRPPRSLRDFLRQHRSELTLEVSP